MPVKMQGTRELDAYGLVSKAREIHDAVLGAESLIVLKLCLVNGSQRVSDTVIVE